MVKVGIDIGHGTNSFPPSKGIYKNGKPYEEHDFNSKLGVRLKELLESNGINVVFGQQPFSWDVPLYERKDIYVAEDVSLVVSIHANYNGNSAVNGRCGFYWHTNSKTKGFVQDVMKFIKSKGYETHGNGLHPSRYNSWTNLYITRVLPMDSALIEHGFMSGSRDFDYVFGSKQAKHIEDMAQANAQAIVEHFGKYYKSTKTSNDTPKGKTYYRVQVGAFKDTASVAAYAQKVEDKTGFETYVTEVGEWLKVQIGAFSNKKNAEQRLTAVKKHGYTDAFITTQSGRAVPETEPYNDPAPEPVKSKWKLKSGNWTGGTLKQWDYGSQVKQLQELLAENHYYPEKGAKNNGIDSYFAANTKNAVERYQSMHGLAIDGVAGKATYNSLKQNAPQVAKSKNKYPLPNETYWVKEPRFNGDGVKQVQEALASIHYYPNKGAKNNGVDGWYGPDTADAVKRFQSMYGLKQDGDYGPATRKKLDEEVN